MKILYIDFARETYKIGGGQAFLKNLIKEIDHSKIELFVYSLSDSSIFDDLTGCNIEKNASDLNVVYHRCGIKDKIVNIIHSLYKNIIKIRKIVNGEDIDILHLNGNIPFVVVFLSLIWINKKIVFHIHHIQKCFLGKIVITLLSLISNRVICVSDFVMRDMNVFKMKRWMVIHNGIDVSYFYEGIRNNSILAVGNLLPIKGYGYVLEAIKKVQDTIRKNNFKIYVVGNGPERGRLEKYVDNNNLSDIVVFLGFRNDIQYLMRNSKIVISYSSDPEAFGLVIAEGMKNGCLTIASDLGGAKELIDNAVNGYLIEARNADKLAVALVSCIEKDEEEIIKVRENAKKKIINEFDIRKQAQLIINEYFEMVNL